MSEEAFCFIAMVRDRARLSAMLALLPEERRAVIQETLNRLGDLSDDEVRGRWKQMREQESGELSNRAAEQTGIRMELMPPFVQEWICERARNS